MTLRDVHDRCVTCGRPPGEACCEICHRVHRALWQQVLDGPARAEVRALAYRALAEGVNTEAVNQ